MNMDRKERLKALGAEALAEALLDLARRDDAVDDLVGRLTASPQENINRFKAKLSGLKRARRFVPTSESGGLADELLALLEDLKAGVADPRTGAELMAAFYETDKSVFDRCDDSNGSVGDVYRYEAKDLFVAYASRCTEKQRLIDLVLKLNRIDDYGVRDALIDCAVDYLDEAELRTMIARIEELSTSARDRQHWLAQLESLARQVKDAPLFERSRIAGWGGESIASRLAIAAVYLDCGDAATALSWLERIAEGETFKADERDHLLYEVHGRLGHHEAQAAVAWRIFRAHRSAKTLEQLLKVIGAEERAAVIAAEAAAIMGKMPLSTNDALFLIENARMEDAETYLLDRSDQLNGDHYWSLLPLLQALDAQGRALAASLLNRALLDSILRRAQSKIYPHGVRYLKQLDRLAIAIPDWKSMDDHGTYLAQLRQKHGRKAAFWSKYDG